jgi:hypothetical protein
MYIRRSQRAGRTKKKFSIAVPTIAIDLFEDAFRPIARDG